jgi:pyridoxal phosphate enzyme (YggS family)
MLNPPQILAERLTKVRDRMATACAAAGRTADCVTLLAVSKGHPAESVRAASQLGVQDFGESYLQEAVSKIAALKGLELTWHYIGQIQANKTKPIAEHFSWVHTVDRLKVLERLSAQRPYYAPDLQVCVQVRLAAEAGKGGAEPADVLALAQAAQQLPKLKLRGLMCIPPPETLAAKQEHWFRMLAELAAQLRANDIETDTLSMGMSDDLEAAIRCGSTLIRVGTAIFGPRDAT